MIAAELERELAETPRRFFTVPFLISVMLHGGILLLFTQTVFSLTPDASSVAERPSVRVAVTMRPVQEPPAAPVPAIAETLPPEPSELPEAGIAEPAVAQREPAPTQRVDVVEEAASAEAVEPAASTETGARFQAWTPARIRAAVQTSSAELRSIVTGQWVEDCMLEQKVRGTRDCDEQRAGQDYLSASAAAGRSAGIGAFASVTRADQQWLLAEQFKKSNDTLRELVDVGGMIGELATTRYYMNRDYIIYLSGNRVNGNHNDLVFHAAQNFTADALGGPRMLLNGDMPFQCRSKKKIEYDTNLATSSVSGGNVVPCIYEFTGFEIERPEADPDAFRVVPIVLGSQR